MKEIGSRLSIQLKFWGIKGFHSVYSKKKPRVRVMAKVNPSVSYEASKYLSSQAETELYLQNRFRGRQNASGLAGVDGLGLGVAGGIAGLLGQQQASHQASASLRASQLQQQTQMQAVSEQQDRFNQNMQIRQRFGFN